MSGNNLDFWRGRASDGDKRRLPHAGLAASLAAVAPGYSVAE